jgi:hypothetical protein
VEPVEDVALDSVLAEVAEEVEEEDNFKFIIPNSR